jgi:hypothetical protein
MEEHINRLKREVRLLKGYVLAVLLLLGTISLAAFHQAGRTRFSEIDVERLNVIEKDGTLRLAIANPERLPAPTFYGKEYPGIRGGVAPGNPGIAGMIYFNDEGTEMGGFGWSGGKTDDGGHRAVGLLTFDQYNQNEVMALTYVDENGRRSAGLTIYDRPNVSLQPVIERLYEIAQLPDGPERTRRRRELADERRERGETGARRVYAGRDRSKAAVVTLADPQGRPRLRMSVDSLGAPRLEFLDENGTVTRRLPGAQ